MLGDLLEDSFDFRAWSESLNIKKVDSIHDLQSALKTMIYLNGGRQPYPNEPDRIEPKAPKVVDGIQYNHTVKPKAITIDGDAYLQVTLHQGPDLLRGVYFPVDIEDVRFSYTTVANAPGKWRPLMDLTPRVKAEQSRTGYLLFPTPFPRLALQKVRLAVRLDPDQLEPRYWPELGFTMVEMLLEIRHFNHLNQMSEGEVGLFSMSGQTDLVIYELDDTPKITENGERVTVPPSHRWMLIDAPGTLVPDVKKFAQALVKAAVWGP